MKSTSHHLGCFLLSCVLSLFIQTKRPYKLVVNSAISPLCEVVMYPHISLLSSYLQNQVKTSEDDLVALVKKQKQETLHTACLYNKILGCASHFITCKMLYVGLAP